LPRNETKADGTPISESARLRFRKKNDQKTHLTKNNLRSYGYGLSRKPRIFQPVEELTERAQMGAAWRASSTGASRCLGIGRDESAPLLFLDFPLSQLRQTQLFTTT
jgi:hypothetical protein